MVNECQTSPQLCIISNAHVILRVSHLIKLPVRTATALLSEKDLPAAHSTTLGEDTDLASADLLRDVRGDTTSTSDPPAAARVHRRAPRGSLIRTSAQIQA